MLINVNKLNGSTTSMVDQQPVRLSAQKGCISKCMATITAQTWLAVTLLDGSIEDMILQNTITIAKMTAIEHARISVSQGISHHHGLSVRVSTGPKKRCPFLKPMVYHIKQPECTRNATMNPSGSLVQSSIRCPVSLFRWVFLLPPTSRCGCRKVNARNLWLHFLFPPMVIHWGWFRV